MTGNYLDSIVLDPALGEMFPGRHNIFFMDEPKLVLKSELDVDNWGVSFLDRWTFTLRCFKPLDLYRKGYDIIHFFPIDASIFSRDFLPQSKGVA